jgi:dihydropteroate synthase
MKSKDIIKWPKGQLDLSAGCLVMGILNVTPDSFSDGGEFLDVDRAVAHGVMMAKAGAAIIDVGPESTRPGSERVGADEQIARAIPVIEKLSRQSRAVVSIDTTSVEVAAEAIEAGAGMINDITALADERMAELASRGKVPVVLMHMQGSPATMQEDPQYDDVVKEIIDFLGKRANFAQSFGIDKEMIFIDPGIGFGKTGEHNLELLRNIDAFVATGYKVLVGASRKRFIGQITGKDEPGERIFGTAATAALCARAGVAVVRVHDVPEMAEVVKIANSIKKIQN